MRLIGRGGRSEEWNLSSSEKWAFLQGQGDVTRAHSLRPSASGASSGTAAGGQALDTEDSLMFETREKLHYWLFCEYILRLVNPGQKRKCVLPGCYFRTKGSKCSCFRITRGNYQKYSCLNPIPNLDQNLHFQKTPHPTYPRDSVSHKAWELLLSRTVLWCLMLQITKISDVHYSRVNLKNKILFFLQFCERL